MIWRIASGFFSACLLTLAVLAYFADAYPLAVTCVVGGYMVMGDVWESV